MPDNHGNVVELPGLRGKACGTLKDEVPTTVATNSRCRTTIDWPVECIAGTADAAARVFFDTL
jgi:hypothetical protein